MGIARTSLRGIAAVIVALVLCAFPAGRPAADGAAAPLAARLVGTWRLVRFVDTDAAGKDSYPFGEHPLGYFVYDPTGHLSVQIMRTPATPPFTAGDDAQATDAEVRAAFEGYVAYFGTYRVDERANVLTHVVEGSLRPGYTGTEQRRPFRLEGDTLIISLGDQDGRHYRELTRVR